MGKRITAAYPIAKAGGIPINTSIPASKETYDRLGGRDVAFVVLHYTGNVRDTAEANCKYFAGGDREASAHYFVDEDSIYQSVPACDRAWAVGSPAPVHPLCRNTNSISIEMCCSGNYHVSERTKANAAALTAELCKLLGISGVDTYVLRHYDVTGKLCPKYWVDDPQGIVRFRNMVKERIEMVSKCKMIIDGKEIEVERILKGGTNYIKIRDIAKALDLDVSNKGNIPILNHKQ